MKLVSKVLAVGRDSLVNPVRRPAGRNVQFLRETQHA